MELLSDLTQSFQALSNIVQALRSLKDKAKPQAVSNEFTIELNQAIIEMQSIVMDAQQEALAAQTREKHLVSRITELEQKVMRSEDWDKGKTRYVLANVAGARRGTSIAYKLCDELKEDGEPTHYICQNCYDNCVRSILQPVTGFGLQCLECAKRGRQK